MKLLLLGFFLVSFSSLAQDNYHSLQNDLLCMQETCLKSLNGNDIGFYQYEQRDGTLSKKLNTDSSILDINFAMYCYLGSQAEVLEILSSLEGNTDRDYFNGGHSTIIASTASLVDTNTIEKVLEYRDDYEVNTQMMKILIKRCE